MRSFGFDGLVSWINSTPRFPRLGPVFECPRVLPSTVGGEFDLGDVDLEAVTKRINET